MPTTIRDSESAYLLGATRFERWKREFQGRYMAPVGVALLGMTLAELKRNPAKAANVPPQALANVQKLFGQLTGQPARPTQPSARYRAGGKYGP